MTVYDTSLDLLIANLYVKFLKHPSSVAMGVPAEGANMKVLPMDITEAPDYPSVVVSSKEAGSTGARRVVSNTIMLITWIKSMKTGAAAVAEQTTLDQASTWIGNIDRRIRQMEDTTDMSPIAGWKTWFATLDADFKKGWRITKLVPHGLAPVQRNEKLNTIFYGCVIDVHVAMVKENE